MKNYYPRLKSVLGKCALALSSAFMVFNSENSVAQTVSFSPLSAIVGAGNTVTITGTGFNILPGANTVYFGGAKGTVTSATATSLGVTVPLGASYSRIMVGNNTTYAWAASANAFNPLYNNSCYNAGSITSQPKIDYSGYIEPYLAAFADLDGDGKQDMVVLNHSSNTIFVYRNTATPGTINASSFAAPITLTLNAGAAGASNVKFADLDRDGKIDMVVACNRAGGRIVAFRNTSTAGTISFGAQKHINPLGICSEVAIADYDGDGKPDIAAVVATVDGSGTQTGSDSIKIYQNNITTPPAAGFTALVSGYVAYALMPSQDPSSIATGDFDGDGKMDIVCVERAFLTSATSTPGICLFRNISSVGSIAMATRSDISLPNHGQQVIVADLDGDNKQDIIVSASDYFGTTPDVLCVFRNQAVSGTLDATSFAARQDFAPAGMSVTGLAAADYDADGKVDIIAGFFNSGQVGVFKNTSFAGNVVLSSSAANTFTTGAFPTGVSVADIDGDSKPDIITANTFGTNTVSMLRTMGTPAIGATIGGSATLCMPSGTTFTNSVSGGSWSLTNTTLATINSVTGAVTPLAAGTDTVIYMTTCNYDTSKVQQAFTISAPVTVSPISGTATTLCRGTSISLSETTTGGVWSSTNTAIATVSATSGSNINAGGRAAGTATISYTVTNGCGTYAATWPVTVNFAPGPINGTLTVCVGGNTTLTDTAASGTWSSVSTGIATVTGTGVVHGVAAGTSVISYTMPGGCGTAATVTVNSGPTVNPITGSFTYVCLGANLTLSETTGSGTWSSTANSVASVTSSGVVHGNSLGNATISYTVTNSCGTAAVGYPVTVNPVPGNITAASFRVCIGSSISLSNSTSGGTWTASPPAIATITSVGTTGIVGGAGSGLAIVTYTLAGGCYDTALVTVNSLPAAIGGSSSVCVNSTVTLSDASTPGSWGTTGSIVSVNSSSGAVTGLNAGSTNVTFTETATGCTTSTPFTVNPLPTPITGSFSACVGVSNTLASGPSAGTWTIAPSGIASIDPTTGTITGLVPGSATVSFTFTSTGCAVGAPITVSPSPGVISGPATVCLGAFIHLTDTPSTGTWSSSNAVAAPINAVGIVSGAALGTTIISYTLPSSGCRATRTVTVTPPPGAITGSGSLCPFTSITLSDTSLNGVWSSGDNSIAIVNASTGVVTGVSGGTALISYTLLATGCSVFTAVNVHNAPHITGTPQVCVGYTTPLVVDSVGGVWSSTDTMIVKADTATGLLHGHSAGTVIISYTTPAYGCFDTMMVTSYDTVVPALTISVSPTLSLTGHIASVCQNTLVTYTANVTAGGPTPTYQWRVNSLPVGTGATYTYTPGNNDSVSCVVTSNAICATPATARDYIKMNVITKMTPTLNLAPSAGGDTTCLGNPVTLNPNANFAGPSPTFNWHINGVNVGPGSTFTYVPANGDVITVVVHSNYICPLVDSAMDTLHLTVSPIVTPTVTLIGSDTTCDLYPTIFYAQQFGGGTNPSYTFLVNGSAPPAGTVSGNMLAYMANTGDVVTVTMTSNFPCVTTTTAASAPHTITVIPTPVPSISVSVTPGYILAPGMTATFIATPVNPGSAPTYQWKRNGSVIPGATNLTYTTSSISGIDSFTCIMTTHDLCNHISVFGSIIVYIGDNVGIGQVNGPNSMVNIVPNPTRGRFTITGNTGIAVNEEVKIEVTNMLGQVVYHDKFNTVNGALEQAVQLGDQLANGMYILSIQSEHLSKALHFELAR